MALEMVVKHLGQDYSIVEVEGYEYEMPLALGEALVDAGVMFEQGHKALTRPSAIWVNKDATDLLIAEIKEIQERM